MIDAPADPVGEATLGGRSGELNDKKTDWATCYRAGTFIAWIIPGGRCGKPDHNCSV